MTRRAFLLALPGVALLARNAKAQDLQPGGGAAGGDALYLNNGDLIGVRNIQGGTLASPPGSLNLDIGAGSTQNPGDVALNYDIGRRTLIYDGRKNLLASFGPDGIRFYRQPTLPAGRWSWKWTWLRK